MIRPSLGKWLPPIAMVVVIIALIVYFYHENREGFEAPTVVPMNEDIPTENTGPLPWERHPVGGSIPIDLRDKYPQAYYHELDNEAYTKMLQDMFAVPADRYAMAIREDRWSEDVGQQPDLVPGYEAVVAYLQGRVGEQDIQVVHDRWLGCHEARGNPRVHLYKMEVVLYRPFKSHGKHVAMDVMAERMENGTYQFDVIGLAIRGNVIEDRIALFPVRAFDPLEVTEARMVGTPYTAKDLYLLDDATVKMIVDKVRENREKEASEGRR